MKSRDGEVLDARIEFRDSPPSRDDSVMMPTARIVLLTAACFAAVACTSTSSRVSKTYYIISGSTGADLDREISTKGPLKGHALASAAIRFAPVSLDHAETDAGCQFTAARFRVEADITLPRWRQAIASSDRELKTAWKHLSAYAHAHEEMHVRIAETYAVKMGDALLAIPPKKTCEDLETVAERVIDKIQKDHDRAQNRFDRAEQKRLDQYFS